MGHLKRPRSFNSRRLIEIPLQQWKVNGKKQILPSHYTVIINLENGNHRMQIFEEDLQERFGVSRFRNMVY